MEFTEQQVYEALGLGAQAQEPAEPAAQASEVEPAAQNDEQGANEQEPAEPAQVENQPAAGTETEIASAGNSDDDGKTGTEAGTTQTMSPEQRRENAARRRQQEQQAAIDQAVQTAVNQERDRNAAAMKELFTKAGLKNTFTGQPITSMEEFNAWNDQYSQSKLERELKAGKLTTEGLATAIGNHPIVQQAQRLVTQDAEAKNAQRMAAAKEKIDAEIAEIHKIDASITSLDDLLKAPYGQELYAMTKKGYSIKDAHFLLNHERLEQAKLEAARQQGMNSARSKDHMTATNTPRGGGAISVPAADMAIFRQLNPKATDAEIQAFYNNYMKRQKGG